MHGPFLPAVHCSVSSDTISTNTSTLGPATLYTEHIYLTEVIRVHTIVFFAQLTHVTNHLPVLFLA